MKRLPRFMVMPAMAVAVLSAYACAAVTRTSDPAIAAAELRTTPSPAAAPGETLTLVTWNLGYAGLGAGSDFFADGGRAWLPPGRGAVRRNRDAIADWLGQARADVILNQETADAGPINWWTGVRPAVEAALSGYGRAFYPDFRTRLLPPPLRIRNGLQTHVRAGLVRSELWPLPMDGDPYDGALRRRYAALASWIDGPGGCWVVVNVHLAAFDEGADLRRRQIRTLFARAEAERAQGRRVVLGGDWNLRLTPTAFEHTTEAEHLFWVHDFPRELLPAGWTIAADPTIPSVRTNERPYRRGQNYTAVIDGFVVSPDVVVRSVKNADLDFGPSDHQPATLIVAAEGAAASACSA